MFSFVFRFNSLQYTLPIPSPPFHLFFHQKCLLPFPVSLWPPSIILLQRQYSVCPFVPVHKCEQRGLCPASLPLSVRLKEVFIDIDQFKILNSPLHDVRKRHCKELSESMHKKGYEYSQRVMIVSDSLDLNPFGIMENHLLAIEPGQKLVDGDSKRIFLDAWAQQAAIAFCPRASGSAWTGSHICMHVIMRQGLTDTRKVETITIRRIRATFSALGHRSSTVVETMKVLVNCASTSELYYNVKLWDVCIKTMSTILCRKNSNQSERRQHMGDMYRSSSCVWTTWSCYLFLKILAQNVSWGEAGDIAPLLLGSV